MEQLKGGYVNTLFKSGESINKSYKSEVIVREDELVRLHRERYALNRFKESDVPVPRLMGYDLSQRSLHMEYISGFPLEDYVHKVDSSERQSIFTRIGVLLRAIHTPVNSQSDYLIRVMESKLNRNVHRAATVLAMSNMQPAELLKIISTTINKNILVEAGTTRIHRDFWLNNILYDGNDITGVIDWECAGIGSPYEDFAIVNLWIERVHNDAQFIWKGYGSTPHQETVLGYLLAKCVEFLSIVPYSQYEEELAAKTGFFYNKFVTIQEVLKEINL